MCTVFSALALLLLMCCSDVYTVSCPLALLLVCGAFVNGPYALITTAVSADLGTHPQLRGNARALATVTAIIDGTGSMGGYRVHTVGPMGG